MSGQFPPKPPGLFDLPLAELGYAHANERSAARPVLAILMALAMTTLVNDLTMLVMFVYAYVSAGGAGSSVMSRSVVPLTVAVFRILAATGLLVTAAIGWRERRVRAASTVSLIYGIILVVLSLTSFAYDWSQFGSRSWIDSYVVQRTIIGLTPGIVPLVSFVMLRRLAASWGE